LFIDERLEVGGDRVVFVDEIREFVNDDDESFGSEFLSEIVEGFVPAVDPGDAIVEVVSDVFDELLTLSGFSFLGR
jgi:hypothetical protein